MKGILLLLFTLLSAPISTEVISLDSGGGEYCYVSSDASYEIIGGELQPEKGLFYFFPTEQKPFIPTVGYSKEVERGAFLKITTILRQMEGQVWVAAELRDREGRTLVRAEGFRLAGFRGREVWSLLLGIPSTLPGGEYILVLEGGGRQRRFIYLGEISVIPRQFAFERIDLTARLSGLLTEPDERKEQEARELAELLRIVNTEAQYHFGTFLLPLEEARITSGYAHRREYRFGNGQSIFSLHNGIDLAAPEGTTIRACGTGRIVMASARIITGNSVVIEHLPGVYSLYFHLRDMDVRVGELVKKGQSLGSVGTTGLATGPHLHWELRVSGVAVDPKWIIREPLLDKRRFLSIIKNLD